MDRIEDFHDRLTFWALPQTAQNPQVITPKLLQLLLENPIGLNFGDPSTNKPHRREQLLKRIEGSVDEVEKSKGSVEAIALPINSSVLGKGSA